MRTLQLVSGAVGVACLARPGQVARAAGAPDSEKSRVFVRVLGGRHLAQAAVLAAWPTRGMHTLGAIVDGLHGLSMVGLGAADEELRRPAYTNAALAAGFMLWTWRRRRALA